MLKLRLRSLTQVVKNSQELDSYNGNRLWSQYKDMVPDSEKPGPNALTLYGGLLIYLKGGFLINSAQAASLAFESLLPEELKEQLRKYQEALKRLNDQSEIAQIFRAAPEELRWEEVPGSEHLRLTTYLPAAVRAGGAAFGAAVGKCNETRFVRNVIESRALAQGFVTVTQALRTRFPSIIAERAVPFMDHRTLRCDLLAFYLFARATGSPLSSAALDMDVVCSTLIGLDDPAAVASQMCRALAMPDSPEGRRLLEELGVSKEAHEQAIADILRAHKELEERVESAKELANESKATAQQALMEAMSSQVAAQQSLAQAISSQAQAMSSQATAQQALLQALSSQTAAEQAIGLVDDVRARCVLPDDQLIVSKFLEERRVYFGDLSPQDGRLLFGELVAGEIARRGMSETVSREVFSMTEGGGELRRNVYRRSVHLEVFDYVLRNLWQAALQEEQARRADQAIAIHRAAEFLALYEAALSEGRLPELPTYECAQRLERMKRKFRAVLVRMATRMGAPPRPLGRRGSDGHVHEFLWTREHLPVFRAAFSDALEAELRRRPRTRSPRRSGR